MEAFVRGIRLISGLCGIVAATLIGLSVAVICEMVFVRKVLNHSTIWQTDFVIYSLIAATFIGAPYVLTIRGHVHVDVLPQHVGPRTRYRLAVFALVLSLAFSLVMTALTAQFWQEAWDNNWVSDTMWRARLWIPYSSMPIGLGLLTLQFVAELFDLVTGRQPPFGIRSDEAP